MLIKKHKKTKSLSEYKIFRNLLVSVSHDSPSRGEGDFEEELRQHHIEESTIKLEMNEEEIKLLEEKIPSRKVSKSLSSYLMVDKDKEKFKNYVKEKCQLEEFNFYTIYKKFINQKNKEEKKNLREQIFKEFIDEKGGNSLTLDSKKRNKIIKKYESNEENPFKSIFTEVKEAKKKKIHF